MHKSVAQLDIWSTVAIFNCYSICFEIEQLGAEIFALHHCSNNEILLLYRTSISTGKIGVYHTDAPVRGAHISYFRSGMCSVCFVAPTLSPRAARLLAE